MKEFSTFHFHAPPGILKEAVSSARIPEKLLEPLRAIVTFITAESGDGPGIYYLLSRQEDKEIRDHIGYLVAEACSARFSPVYLVDCDYTSPGMSGIVPDPGAMGFLDTILYGTSLGSVAQDVGRVKVISAGSFPVSNRMPFSLDAFEDVERYMRNQSRCIIMSGPLEDDGGNVHPLAPLLKKILYVTCSGGGAAFASRDPRLREIEGARVAEVEVTVSHEGIPESAGGGEARAEGEGGEMVRPGAKREPDETLQAKEPVRVRGETTSKREEAGEAEIRGLMPGEEGGSSMLPRVVTAVLGLLLVAFLIYWFFATRPLREAEPPLAGGKAGSGEPASVSTTENPPGKEAVSILPGTTQVSEREVPIAPGTTRTTAETTSIAVREQGGGEKPPVGEPAGRGAASAKGAEAIGEPGSGAEPGIVDLSTLKGKFLVHISSFRTLERAKNDAGYLAGKGFPAFIVKVDLGNKGRWFRVYVGPFATRDEARSEQIKLDELPRVKFSRIAEVRS